MRVLQLKPRLNWPRLAALCVVLVLAQATAVAHLDFDEAHAADGVCSLCVGASVIGAGNVAVERAVALTPESAPAIEFVGFSASLLWLDHRYARGPPQAS